MHPLNTLRFPSMLDKHRRFGRQVTTRAAFATLLSAMLAGCVTAPVARVDNHLRAPTQVNSSSTPEPRSAPPAIVQQVPLPPAPKPTIEEKRYSVAVVDVPARDILLAISRDTGINIDVHPGIEGRVTLNAIDQTVRQILTRMSKQVDMRWETDGTNLSVMTDSPYLKLYRVDYVNINREAVGTFGVQTQVVAPAGTTQATGGSSGAQNSSQLRIENSSKNRFWESLEKNIKELLRETDKQLPEGSTETVVRGVAQAVTTGSTRSQSGSTRANTNASRTTSITGPGETQQQSESVSQVLTFREAASVIVNAETGTISVRATSRQHEKISQFVEQVSSVAKRQVMIEATVVEVLLNDGYESGVDWSRLNLRGAGFSFQQTFGGTALAKPGEAGTGFTVGYTNTNQDRSIQSTVKLLETFGTTKVLSSPRTMTLNNQPAVLKVVENKVYFTVKSDTQLATSTSGNNVTTYTTTPNVVPVGFVMHVTPQIGENDIVTLNIRPSITKQVGEVQDPNPDLRRTNTESKVPVIETREFETVLRVASGQTTVLGGLMQDSVETKRDGLPYLSRIPLFGDAVSYRNDVKRRSELIIFIRPFVLKDASVDTDLAEYRRFLPERSFFKEAEGLLPSAVDAVPPRK